MDLFARSLQAFRASGPNAVCAAERNSISLTLSHCARKSLGANWGVDFGTGGRLDWCTDDRFADLDLECGGMSKGEPEPADPKRPTRAN
jgi:hypothetical protein